MSWAETKLILDAIVENGIGSANGTIVMIPMDANKYGYNLKLYDIDGVTPLSDVKINGVTDPNTEIRTNAQGIAKFISGSPSHSVSFTEFPSGYQYADIFTARTIRGYINDMTEVIVAPDISQFAGYNITLKDNTGANVSNQSVKCTQNGKTYTTDSSGKIPQTIYSDQTSLTFTWSTTVSAGSSGVLSGTSIYSYSAQVTGGALGQTTTVTSNNASRSESTTWKISSAATVGNYITIGSKQYIIADVTSSTVYVTLRYWEENTVFDNGASTDYVGSDIAAKCTTWYNQIPELWRANACTSISTEGVSAACFIPTYNQVNGGWDYFNSDDRRIFKNSGGTAQYWWTSSKRDASYVCCVSTGGSFDNRTPYNSFGFRPALAIKRSLFVN